MSERSKRRGFSARPSNPDAWIRAADAPATHGADAASFTARLTIDITPELRGRIKIVAFQRGVTVADMLRELLAREFPKAPGDTP
jgi:hypothetical protein